MTKTTTPSVFSFSYFKELFETKLKDEVFFFEKNELGEACRYSLLSGGKRLRPIIVYLVGHSLQTTEDLNPAALCLEYFHTASLVADDLPCMDNDDFRREVLTTHKKFGEATALLASYAMIVAAFEKIHQAEQISNLVDKERRGLLALKEVSFAAGMYGATGGQFFDLFSKKEGLNDFYEMIERKTVRLFEVSFLLGWIFGGGELCYIETVRKLGHHFGFAFQLFDDLNDFDQDAKKPNQANLSILIGKEKTKELFENHMSAYYKHVNLLSVKKEGFLRLGERLCPSTDKALSN